jgi:iron complex transport system ATP-binding protein
MIMSLRGIEFSYNSHRVLKDVNLDIGVRDVLAILGPNGVGKTTLLRCMNAILPPSAGAILIEGEDLLSLNRSAISRRIAYVPQRSEAGRVSVFDAVLLGRKPHITWDVTGRDLRIVQNILERLDLTGLSLRNLDQISGGELQKVAIARALVQEPGVLLLDEPTSSLDLKNQIDILTLLKQVAREHSVTALMTMHDINLAARFATKFVLMKDGRIHAAGNEDILTSEIIEEVYSVPVSVVHQHGKPVIIPIIDRTVSETKNSVV